MGNENIGRGLTCPTITFVDELLDELTPPEMLGVEMIRGILNKEPDSIMVGKVPYPLVMLFHKSELETKIISECSEHYQHHDLPGGWVFAHAKFATAGVANTNAYIRALISSAEKKVFASDKWEMEHTTTLCACNTHLSFWQWCEFFSNPSPMHFFGLLLGLSHSNQHCVTTGGWYRTSDGTYLGDDLVAGLCVAFGYDVSMENGLVAVHRSISDIVRGMFSHPLYDQTKPFDKNCTDGLQILAAQVLVNSGILRSGDDVTRSWLSPKGVAFSFFFELIDVGRYTEV